MKGAAGDWDDFYYPAYTLVTEYDIISSIWDSVGMLNVDDANETN